MLLKNIVYEDFVNYKNPAMFVLFPHCSFKCERECGVKCCQNSPLTLSDNTDIKIQDIVSKYMQNDITKAIVCGGLEPFDSWEDLALLVKSLREKTTDDIVIYTGYNPEEINYMVFILKQYKNIIIKYGRFVPNKEPHFDEVLGVNLASPNQYAEKIS